MIYYNHHRCIICHGIYNSSSACDVDFIYPSTAAAIIQGGTKENIIPHYCAITLNRRFTSEENLDDVRKELKL